MMDKMSEQIGNFSREMQTTEKNWIEIPELKYVSKMILHRINKSWTLWKKWSLNLEMGQ